MKILIANKFFYKKGGAEVVTFELADLLKRKQNNVIFFSMQHPLNLQCNESRYFISTVTYLKKSITSKLKAAVNIFYSWEARKKIDQLLVNEKPGLVHLHNIYHQISSSIIHSVRKYNLPIVMTLHDYKLVCASYQMLANGHACEACKDGKYYHCFEKKCTKDSRAMSLLNTAEMYFHHSILHIYDLIHAFISPSIFLKNKIKEMGFKGEVFYLPNFVNLEDFTPCYDFEDASIVYFGRLSKEKGLNTLIAAVAKVNSITLRIIGEGPLGSSLEDRVKSQELKNIEFLGYKSGEELKNEIKKSMFVVVPSAWYENNPRSVIEAFALGKSVIGARIGGIPELVKDKVTGLTFESGNADDLKEKISYLVSRPDLIREMGQNARRFVEEELNEEKHYQGLMKIYQYAIDKNNKK